MLSEIEMAQDDYNINVKDTHRADKKRKSQKKKSKEKGAAKKKLKFFEKNVQDVNIDVVKCDVSMSKFCFTLLDTMGYIQEVTITKDAVSCTGPSCSGIQRNNDDDYFASKDQRSLVSYLLVVL